MPEMVFVVVLKCVSGIVHQCEALKRAGLGGKNSRAPIVESLSFRRAGITASGIKIGAQH